MVVRAATRQKLFSIPLWLSALASPCIAPAQSAPGSAVPGAGEKFTNDGVPRDALRPGVMLASHWQAGLDPSLYLVSEKYDGVRALWDGKTLRFRSGRQIHAPDWFLAGLPDVPLDGELWLGRRRFDALSGAVRKLQPPEAEWRQVQYLIFDSPAPGIPFADRVAAVRRVIEDRNVSWLIAVEQVRIKTEKDLAERLLATTAAGGEGLMLHRADALWEDRRSDSLRKFKPTPDEDGQVVASIPGKGRFAGQMGALLIRAPDGQFFSLGTGFSHQQRQDSLPVGSWITYRYRERTPAGLPRFASFLRLREAD